MSGEDKIHRRYARLQAEFAQRNKKMRQIFTSAETPEHDVVSPRWNQPSFRSKPFNIGEGLVTINSGQTALLAKKNLPAGHSGVLTGFTQIFPESADETVINSITWALRIDGLPINDFNDFVGRFSLPYTPCPVNVPLIGSDTLGTTSFSPGGSAAFEQEIPTIAFYATNNTANSITLQARLIGYSFPLAEKNDQFFSF